MRHRGRRFGRTAIAALLIAAIASTGCTSTQSAASTAPSSVQGADARWNYVSPAAINATALLPAPVDATSPSARDFEVQLTARMHEVAGPVLRYSAEADEDDSVWQFSDVMGPQFTPAGCPRIAAFMQRATADANRIKNRAKDYYSRRRPPTATEAGETYADAHLSATESEDWSYPSGHATRAALWACLLGEIDPSKAEPLLESGWFMCLSRIVRGVHFPSDITAGFILGQAIAKAIALSPDAAADLEAARAEWSAVSSMRNAGAGR
jgi:membrane-associated phospholipid phosphatase